jgi:hypothetical protein
VRGHQWHHPAGKPRANGVKGVWVISSARTRLLA